jgi:glutaredoxin-related protein
VLDNQELREGIKAYTNWPTIPQLYVKGEFVGGADILTEITELHVPGRRLLQILLRRPLPPAK